MKSTYIGHSFSEPGAEGHGYPELAGSRPEDGQPVDVAEERVEAERRHEAFVADGANGRSRSKPAAV